MRKLAILLVATAILSVFMDYEVSSLRAEVSNSTALNGRVVSQEEGMMEGVLVTARRADATFTVTVVSDQQGRYSFPRNNLEPGEYTLRIRAIGYDLDGPATVRVTAQKTAALDLKLRKTQNLAAQLTSQDWLNSFPGNLEQKTFLLNCVRCHTLERVAESHHDAEEWLAVYQRMGTYYGEGSARRPQILKQREGGGFGDPERLRKQAEYMSTISLSTVEKWTYPLKTLPRPTGRATHVIITEYDLPREDSVPHDLIVDSKGQVWYADGGWMYVGKLDPKTAKVTEYPIPGFKPENPVGMEDVELDKNGNLWIAIMNQGNKFMKFNTKTMKPTFWDMPADTTDANRLAFVASYNLDVDGKVWATDDKEVFRLNIASGQVDNFKPFQNMPGGARGHSIYQITSDSHNDCYFLEFTGGGVGEINAKTGDMKFYPTPTPNSYSRRGNMDSQDHLWFGEFYGNRIGMFDTHDKSFKEWEVPNPWTAPYAAGVAKNGDVWASGITSDRVQRLDPKTGQIVEYLLPRYTDARKLSVDESSGQSTLWIPNKNSASLIKLQPIN